MDTLKTKFASAKEWYLNHERTILFSTIAVLATTTGLMRYGLKEKDDFLKEHDLYEEFYNQYDEE